MIYDCNNMPLAEYKGNTRYDYTYDANGTRISKTIGKNTTYYTHGVSGNAEMETIIGTSSTTNRYYIWGLDHLGHITSAMHYYYLKDHLGSIRMTINKNGKVVSYNDYYPYGSIMPMRSMNMAMADERYKFNGKEQDAETGYDYFGARYYDALRGQWTSADVFKEKYPRLSPYCYSGNNPINSIDPNGKYIRFVINDIYCARQWTIAGAENQLMHEAIPFIGYCYIGDRIIRNDPSFRLTSAEIGKTAWFLAGDIISGGAARYLNETANTLDNLRNNNEGISSEQMSALKGDETIFEMATSEKVEGVTFFLKATMDKNGNVTPDESADGTLIMLNENVPLLVEIQR